MIGGLTALLLAAAPASSGVEGQWLTAERNAIVTIAPCGAQVCGTIAKVLVTRPGVPRTDVNNRDPKLRARPLVGLPILRGFTRSGGTWKGGRAYDPKSGREYRSTLQLEANGTLKVTGCVAFICQSQYWTRAR